MTSRVFGPVFRRGAALAVALTMALAGPTVVPAEAGKKKKEPEGQYILVRGGQCGDDGWGKDKDFDSAGKVENMSVWCYSKKVKLRPAQMNFPTSAGPLSVCYLLDLVKAPHRSACIARPLAVKQYGGTAVYATVTLPNGSKTENHCHVSGLTKVELKAAFLSRVNDCPDPDQ